MVVRFSGFGGQGIILAGYILGKAVIIDGKNSLQTQSYGSESRGGTCKSDVFISDEKIYEFETEELDVLVSMSQTAYERYIPLLKKDGLLFIDKDLVKPENTKVTFYEIDAVNIAEKIIGRKIMANIVMLGFLTGVTNVVSYESMKKSIMESVPEKTIEQNVKALDEGYRRGKEMN